MWMAYFKSLSTKIVRKFWPKDPANSYNGCKNRMVEKLGENCLSWTAWEETASLKDIKGTHSSGSASAKVPWLVCTSVLGGVGRGKFVHPWDDCIIPYHLPYKFNQYVGKSIYHTWYWYGKVMWYLFWVFPQVRPTIAGWLSFFRSQIV